VNHPRMTISGENQTWEWSAVAQILDDLKTGLCAYEYVE